MNVEIKNVKKVNDDEYICEINHPEYGWIPYSAINDTDEELMRFVFGICDKTAGVKHDLDLITAIAKTELILMCESKISELENNYTSREINLWSSKRNEADKVISGGKSQILELEASVNDINVVELAKTIIDKNERYNSTIVFMEAMKSKIVNSFNDCSSLEEINKLRDNFYNIILEYNK